MHAAKIESRSKSNQNQTKIKPNPTQIKPNPNPNQAKIQPKVKSKSKSKAKIKSKAKSKSNSTNPKLIKFRKSYEKSYEILGRRTSVVPSPPPESLPGRPREWPLASQAPGCGCQGALGTTKEVLGTTKEVLGFIRIS